MYQKPAKLKIELEFKEPGLSGKRHTCKPGKAVKVDRHRLNPGQYVIWATKRTFAVIEAIQLHDTVEFKDGL